MNDNGKIHDTTVFPMYIFIQDTSQDKDKKCKQELRNHAIVITSGKF